MVTFFPNGVDVKLNVGSLPVVDRVPKHVDGGYVVVKSHSHQGNFAEELVKNLISFRRLARDNRERLINWMNCIDHMWCTYIGYNGGL